MNCGDSLSDRERVALASTRRTLGAPTDEATSATIGATIKRI
jgi:hypothetical protein